MKMKKLLTLCIAVLLMASLFAGCGSSAPAAPGADNGAAAPVENTGKTYTFKIDFPNPENCITYVGLTQWADYIREQSNGQLDFQIYANGALGSIADCVTNCETGMTDGFWSAQAIYQGNFRASEAVSLPMMGIKNAEVGSRVLMAMLNETDYYNEEYGDVHVVALHSSCTIPIGFKDNKPVTDMDGLKGLKMRYTGGFLGQWVTNIGAEPIFVSSNDGYEYLEKNIINAYLYDYDKMQSGALLEQTGYIIESHIYASQLMFCLNKDKYNELPDDLKKLIDDSAEYYLDLIHPEYTKQRDTQLADAASRGIEVSTLSDEMHDAFVAAAEPVWQAWIEDMNANGYDGQGIFDKTKEYIEMYNEMYDYYN